MHTSTFRRRRCSRRLRRNTGTFYSALSPFSALTCSRLRSYITYDGSASLMTEASHMGEQLRLQLQELVSVAGVRVVSFGLSDLAYAPEIAAAMLVRQQAQATLDARKLITAGAVGVACDALDELAARGRTVAPDDASRFLSSLVMVIAAERAPQPTIEVL